MKERVAYFDNIKGILILTVVLSHFMLYWDDVPGSTLLITVRWWTNMFVMPAFLFASGIFAGRAIHDEKAYSAHKILVYGILFLIVGYVLMFETSYLKNGVAPELKTILAVFNTTTAAWYLLAITIYTMTVPTLAKLRAGLMLPIVYIFSLSEGFWIQAPKVLSLGKVVAFLPYFVIGFYLTDARMLEWRRYVGNLKPAKRLAVYGAAIALFAAVYTFLALRGPGGLGKLIHNLESSYRGYEAIADMRNVSVLEAFLGRTALYALVPILIFAIVTLVPIKKLPFITRAGTNSLQIYIFHVIIYYIIFIRGIDTWLMAQSPLWRYAPFVIAPLLTWLLSLPSAPNKWVKSLDAFCRKALRQNKTL
ncbi:MAG: acyltransferase family protein [Clostridiales Family XIII bacterium]|jgi:fucose 4-O-acetylase-like acetyltransferase|nr:acyltransferase family protein [Clostridiales Family XIII bacterium]